ncbi:sensor histidine kinase [Desmospora profundinema]|uniref:histidine kinase n=1 Tax=Desmospora profundinema TaxID=1571184 RepID=A0ABU1IRI1_9BACL|nr:HAMP domain-containing sensor histidine kinase [Desmospora profundinema]MDR6227333.1 signal transduction histidine kinase [Desmospora profundinema]
MKLKWKLPLLFFFLSLALFFLIVFYLRVDVIQGIWERVEGMRKQAQAAEREWVRVLAAAHPDYAEMGELLEQAVETEGASFRLYGPDSYQLLAYADSGRSGNSTEERWYPVRKGGETVAFLQVERVVKEEDVGLNRALTDTFGFLLVFLLLLFVMLGWYFNATITRPLARLNARLDAVVLRRPLPPLQRKGWDDSEIGELYRRFGEMEKRLYRAHREQVDMVAAIAHDLKTPLTSMNGFLELLTTRYAPTDTKQREYLDLVKRKADNLASLLDHFSAFARDEVSLQEMELEERLMRPLFESIAREYEAELAGLDRACHWSHDLGDERVLLHEPMIRRLFANLVHNAFRHGKRQDLAVWLTATVHGDHIRICVEDNGRGVPREALDALFGRFFTVDASRREQNGSGLGLASCRSIVERHGGRIQADVSSKGGLAVSFQLPLL